MAQDNNSMNVLMTLVGSEDCPEHGDTKDTKVCGEKKNSFNAPIDKYLVTAIKASSSHVLCRMT